jgi:hypothetical protein
MDSIRYNNLVMSIIFEMKKTNINESNFNNLKTQSLDTINKYKPSDDFSYYKCQNMIHYLINLWIPQEQLSDDDYNTVSQKLFSVVSDSLEVSVNDT